MQSNSQPVKGKGVRGTQLAVSPSYQLTYSSSPFAASGKWMGHTLRKQFQTAFQVRSCGPPLLLMLERCIADTKGGLRPDWRHRTVCV